MKYIKKPITIEAVQFDGTYESYLNDIEPFVGRDGLGPFVIDRFDVKTLEGKHVATAGDYIVKGVKGEFYPCKPDIFQMNHEGFDK